MWQPPKEQVFSQNKVGCMEIGHWPKKPKTFSMMNVYQQAPNLNF
jgi:hypothetical protein